MTLLQCGISCEQQSSKGLMSPHLDLWKQGHDAAWASAEAGCGRVGMCGVRSAFLKLAPRVDKKNKLGTVDCFALTFAFMGNFLTHGFLSLLYR